MQWISAYTHLFNILDKSETPAYHSGPQFIKVVQQFNPGLPKYSLYIKDRQKCGKSTSRRDFFWDILTDSDEATRYEIFRAFIDIVSPYFPQEAQALKNYLFDDGNPVPKARVPEESWNSEKLNTLIAKIDNAIDTKNYNHAMTLAYTCLEGLYKSYVKKHCSEHASQTDLMNLAQLVRNDIANKLLSVGPFPNQMVTSISTLTNAIANSRNSFSDSHFDNDAYKWLATYSRDLVNSLGRLLLHFL